MTLAKVKEQDGMTLAKVKEQDGMTLAKVKEQDGMTLAKVKEQDGMTLAKVKEQDGMTLAKVRHAQVSHALRWSAKYPTSARLVIISQMRAPASFGIWEAIQHSMGRALES